jgi:hypothetical protein
MALTPSGTISMSNINSALGRSSTAAISFSDSQVRFLANRDAGSVNMNAMRNKYNFNGTITVGQFVDFTDIYYGYIAGYMGSITGTIFDNRTPNLYTSDGYNYTEITSVYPADVFPNITMRLKVGSNQSNSVTRGNHFDPSATNVYVTLQELITSSMNNTTVNWQFSQA